MYWAEYLGKLHKSLELHRYAYIAYKIFSQQKIEKDAMDIYNTSRLEKMTIIFTAKS